jgi:CheY-like chemotaxis protein
MYDLNLAVDQLRVRLNARFPNVGTETRKSQGAVGAEAIEMLSSVFETVLTSLAEQAPVRRIRLEDGFSTLGEGFSGWMSTTSASFAYLQADIQFESELSAELLPFMQQGSGPVRILGKMAERHEGFLQVESLWPDTLRLCVKLPIAMSEPQTDATTWASDGASILLVEDEEFVRNVTQEVLEMEGFKVLVACNGREALELARKEGASLELLLTDVVLPGMNGRELAGHITDLCPGLKVMFMSGYADNAVLRNDIAVSSWMYLQKPFTLDDLIAKVHEALDVRLPSLLPQCATARAEMELR